MDGLEWRRAKWSGAGRRYYRAAERLAVRWSDTLITDAPAIAAYYRDAFGAEAVQIAYGAPLLGRRTDRLPEPALGALLKRSVLLSDKDLREGADPILRP